MCCRQMSGISRLLTILASLVATRTTTFCTCSASNACFLRRCLERVERRLNRRTDGPFLDVGARDLVALAELVHEHRRVVLRRERLEEVVRAGQHVVDAGAAGFDQQRGRDAVSRGHAAEIERFLDVLGVALPRCDARGLLRRVARAASASAARSGRPRSRCGRGRPKVPAMRVRAAVALHHVLQLAERRGRRAGRCRSPARRRA